MRSCCSVHLGERIGLNSELATAPNDAASAVLRLLPNSPDEIAVEPDVVAVAIGSVLVRLLATACVRPAIHRRFVGA